MFALMLKELGGHDGADRVTATVLGTRVAAAIAVEAGQGLAAARLQSGAQHVAIDHLPQYRSPARTPGE